MDKERGPGRPSKPIAQQRTETVTFKVTPNEKWRIQDAAQAAGTDVANYVRVKALAPNA